MVVLHFSQKCFCCLIPIAQIIPNWTFHEVTLALKSMSLQRRSSSRRKLRPAAGDLNGGCGYAGAVDSSLIIPSLMGRIEA